MTQFAEVVVIVELATILTAAFWWSLKFIWNELKR